MDLNKVKTIFLWKLFNSENLLSSLGLFGHISVHPGDYLQFKATNNFEIVEMTHNLVRITDFTHQFRSSITEWMFMFILLFDHMVAAWCHPSSVFYGNQLVPVLIHQSHNHCINQSFALFRSSSSPSLDTLIGEERSLTLPSFCLLNFPLPNNHLKFKS